MRLDLRALVEQSVRQRARRCMCRSDTANRRAYSGIRMSVIAAHRSKNAPRCARRPPIPAAKSQPLRARSPQRFEMPRISIAGTPARSRGAQRGKAFHRLDLRADCAREALRAVASVDVTRATVMPRSAGKPRSREPCDERGVGAAPFHQCVPVGNRERGAALERDSHRLVGNDDAVADPRRTVERAGDAGVDDEPVRRVRERCRDARTPPSTGPTPVTSV